MPLYTRMLEELRTTPLTMMLLSGLIIAVWRLYDMQPTYATVVALNLVHREVLEMKLSVDKASLQERLQNDTTQLFQVKRLIDEAEKGGKVADAFYYQRLTDLTNDSAALALDLNGVQHAIDLTRLPGVSP